VAGGTMAFAAVPASAAAADYRCTGLADQARAASDAADAGKQKVTKRYVATGLKLCEAGNGRAAAQQFRSALRAAGVEEVQPAQYFALSCNRSRWARKKAAVPWGSAAFFAERLKGTAPISPAAGGSARQVRAGLG